MTITVIGVACDSLGLCTNRSSGWIDKSRNIAYENVEHYATPSSAFHVTKDHLIVDWGHDGKPIGQVAHLELDHGNLWAVAEIDVERCGGIAADLTSQSVYWSPASIDTRSAHGVDAELLALGLTPSPATNALPAVTLFAGDLERVTRLASGRLLPRLVRALEARRHRHRGEPLRILDLDAPPPSRDDRGSREPRGDLELAPRSNSGRFITVEGRRVEVEHSAPVGRVLSVR